MVFNEIKCHVNTSLGLVGGMHPLHPPLCLQLMGGFAKDCLQLLVSRISIKTLEKY